MKHTNWKCDAKWAICFFFGVSTALVWLLSAVCVWARARVNSASLLKEPNGFSEQAAIKTINIFADLRDYYFPYWITAWFSLILVLWFRATLAKDT
jgi:hypothetical protein